MVAFLRVDTFYQEHPGVRVRDLKRCIAVAHHAGGQLWAERLLMEHFLPDAASQFGYAQRNRKYNLRKIRLAALGLVEDGGRQPLVFSGATRQAARRARYLVKATDKEVDVPIPVPRYIASKANRYARQALALEVLAISPRHEKLVTNETERGFHRAVRSVCAERRTTIRS